MKKTISILALLYSLTGVSQTLTITNIITNGNLWGFTLSNPYDQVLRPEGILKSVHLGSPGTFDFIRLNAPWPGSGMADHNSKVDTAFGNSLSTFDSLKIKVVAKMTGWNQNSPTNGSVKYTKNDSVVFNSNKTDTIVFITKNLSSLSFSCIISVYGYIALSQLTIKGYSTTAPTNTTPTTGIKAIADHGLDLFVAGNIVKSNAFEKDLRLKVFDLTGRQVFESALQNSISVDLNEGIYILNVFSENENLIERKRVFITHR